MNGDDRPEAAVGVAAENDLLVGGLGSFYGLALVFGFAYGGVMPLYAIVVREYFGERIMGTAFGAVAMVSTLGMALGPWAGGWVYDRLGSYAWLFIGSAAIGLGAVAIALVVRPPRASTPIVADGCIYVAGTGGMAFALNADTGEVVWESKLKGGVNSTVAVEDGKVFATVSRVGKPAVIALDQDTGKLLWDTTIDNQEGSDVYASAVYYDDMVRDHPEVWRDDAMLATWLRLLTA